MEKQAKVSPAVTLEAVTVQMCIRDRQILADIDAYEIYCKDHKDFKNNKTKVTTERILDVYRKCVETDDFL